VFLVTSNVRLAFNTLAIWEFEFDQNNVAQDSSLTSAQLSEAARQIKDYFNSREEWLDVRVTVDGGRVPLFEQREIQHMKDVKELLGKVYRVQEGAFLYLFLFTAIGLFVRGNDFAEWLRKLLMRSSLVTFAVVILASIGAALAFGPLFTMFHKLGFSNDLWQLDPATSYLVRMFPFGFWLQSTLLIAAGTLVEAGAVLALLVLARAWRERRQRAAQSKAPLFL
ncbi:MAG: TIGR01906 family membrane protein, partial [Chloroflexota bacterium]